MRRFSLQLVVALVFSVTAASLSHAMPESTELAEKHLPVSISATVLQRFLDTDVSDDGRLRNSLDFPLIMLVVKQYKHDQSPSPEAIAFLFTASAILKTEKELHPCLFSAALSQLNIFLRKETAPLASLAATQLGLSAHNASLSYVFPASLNALVPWAYYAKNGNFDGLRGWIAKKPISKCIFLVSDATEVAIVETLQSWFGPEVWIEPIAQLETGIIFAISGLTAASLSSAIDQFSSTVTGFSMMAGDFATPAPSSLRMTSLLLAGFSLIAVEEATKKTTASGFGFTHLVPSEAKIIPTVVNPAIGAGIVYGLTRPKISGWLKHHPGYKAASIGLLSAGLYQIFGALLKTVDYLRGF